MLIFFQQWQQRFRNIISYMRFNPFTKEDEVERGKERYRRIGLGFLASVLARGVGMIATFITVPLTVNYLGAERYGMWFVLSSLISMLAFADLGISNGVLNAVSQAYGKNDRKLIQQYITSALTMLLLIASILGIIFWVIYPLVPWYRLFNVTSELAIAESAPTVAVFMATFLFNMPLGIVQRLQMGLQEHYIDSLWTGAGRLLSIIALLAVIQAQAGLPWLVLALNGTPILVTLLNSYFVFFRRHPDLRPTMTGTNWQLVRQLSQIGFLFFVLQVASTIAFTSDSFVITQILGAERVTDYAVPTQLFRFVIVILTIVLTPLWPAYGDALSNGDWAWIRKTFRASIGISLLISVPICTLIAIFGQWIIPLWVDGAVQPTLIILIALAIWTTMSSFNGPIAMLLNGSNIVTFQIVTIILMSIVNLILSIALTYIMGISGVIWGSIIAQALCVIIPSWIYIEHMFKQKSANNAITPISTSI